MNYELLTKNTMRIFNEIIAKEEENLMNKKIREKKKNKKMNKNKIQFVKKYKYTSIIK